MWIYNDCLLLLFVLFIMLKILSLFFRRFFWQRLRKRISRHLLKQTMIHGTTFLHRCLTMQLWTKHNLTISRNTTLLILTIISWCVRTKRTKRIVSSKCVLALRRCVSTKNVVVRRLATTLNLVRFLFLVYKKKPNFLCLGEHFVKYLYESNPVILRPKNIGVFKAVFVCKYIRGKTYYNCNYYFIIILLSLFFVIFRYFSLFFVIFRYFSLFFILFCIIDIKFNNIILLLIFIIGTGTEWIDPTQYDPMNRSYGGDIVAAIIGRDEPIPEALNLTGYNTDMEAIYQLVSIKNRKNIN